MPRRVDGLFDEWARFGALIEAAQRAARGKRAKARPAAFLANLERRCLRIEDRLLDGSWAPGDFVVFKVRDPKPRVISAAPFHDRVVHQALCAAIEPVFDRGFIYDSYANRKGKGTHRAIARYETYARRHKHVLRCDVFRFFPSIDHEVLKRDFRRRIACERTLSVMDTIVDGSNPQEPVDRYFPGDDLFSPFARRRGLPIGNLTSQLFANVYLDVLDHFATEVLRAPYVRYVDDFALFHDEPAVLSEWRVRIERFLCGRRLLLHPQKTFIAATREPATFLGFELHGDGRRRVPEANVRRFRHRLRGLRDRWRSGAVTGMAVEQHIGAWIAHARHADTWRLRHAIFRGGWFDPSNPRFA